MIIAITISLFTNCSKKPAGPEISGCTDPNAVNFNPDANVSDNSCEYVDIVTDIDGNIYNTVIIGNQEWMIENLKVTHYRNGDLIPDGFNNSEWEYLSDGAYSIYNDDTSNVRSYGFLYNGYTTEDERGVCPEGWQVPTDDEFGELEVFLGMSPQDIQNEGWRGTDEGGKLKETGTEHWLSPNTGATNESGFNAVPAGYRGSDGYYSGLGFNCTFWSSTEHDSTSIWVRKLYYISTSINRSRMNKSSGLSVRCVRQIR